MLSQAPRALVLAHVRILSVWATAISSARELFISSLSMHSPFRSGDGSARGEGFGSHPEQMHDCLNAGLLFGVMCL